MTDRERFGKAFARMADLLPENIEIVPNVWHEVKVSLFFGGDGNVYLDNPSVIALENE